MNNRPKEAWVKEQVRKILRGLGLWYYQPAAAIYGSAGASDFFLCIHGRLLVVEAKRDEKEHPTMLQQEFMDAVFGCGGDSFVVHANNLDEFRLWLATHMDRPHATRN